MAKRKRKAVLHISEYNWNDPYAKNPIKDFSIVEFVNRRQFKFPERYRPDFDDYDGQGCWLWSFKQKKEKEKIEGLKNWINQTFKVDKKNILLKEIKKRNK